MGFLEWLALAIILIVLISIFYTFIYIHELPYAVAESRRHPHAEAIYVACWLSLFTLHAIWPLVFIWAISHKRRGEAGQGGHEHAVVPAGAPGVEAAPGEALVDAKESAHLDLARRLEMLEERLRQLEGRGQ